MTRAAGSAGTAGANYRVPERPLSPEATAALLAMSTATTRPDAYRLAMAAVLYGASAAVAYEACQQWEKANAPQTIRSDA